MLLLMPSTYPSIGAIDMLARMERRAKRKKKKIVKEKKERKKKGE